MVRRPAPQAVDRSGGQPLLHQVVVQQVVLGDPLQVGQAGSVPQHVAHRDVVLAVGAELGPVGRDRGVVVEKAAVDQSMDHGGRDTLGGREHHRAGIGRPRLLRGPIGEPRPDVDDGFAVDIDHEGTPAEAATGKQPGEDAHDVREPRIGCAVQAASADRLQRGEATTTSWSQQCGPARPG